ANLNGTYFVCSTGISGKFAKQLDAQLDDGNTATGSMQVGTTATPSVAVPGTLVDSTNYTVCMGI
ncbi:MAG: prepilin-type cleavage/methylation domain-containing protein, partial [Thiobacillus sp.]|nr:prepilin-type cleavage/methylation domain-containing protein [Thiobacillus sp.]